MRIRADPDTKHWFKPEAKILLIFRVRVKNASSRG